MPNHLSNRNLSLPLVKLLDADLINEGDLLYYKMKGEVKAFGQVRRGGIEVAGKAKLLGFSEFEQHAGSAARRASTYMYIRTGETVQSLLARAGRYMLSAPGSTKRNAAAKGSANTTAAIDDSDEACAVCCLGGDLLCCEACPAVFHLGCLGLVAMPSEDDWHCPACVCARSGAVNFGTEVQLACQVQWMPAGSARSVPHEEASSGGRLTTKASQVKRDPGWDLYLRTLYESELKPTQGLISLAAAAPESLYRDPLPQSTDKNGGRAAGREPFVTSPLSGRRYLMSTLTEQEKEQVTSGREVWFPTEEERKVSHELARMAALGLQPVLNGPGQGKLSYLLIRSAAVSNTPCRGYVPAYSKEQKEDLREVLAAARKLFMEAFDPVFDSRTGRDLLGPLLAGGRLGESSGVDFSGFHTAILWRSGTIVAAAIFRAFGDSLAEIPLLATRPLSMGKSYGAKLLTCIQQSLHAAGVHTAVMPSLVTSEGESLLAAASPAAAAAVTAAVSEGQPGKVTPSHAGPWPLTWAAHSWPRREGFSLPVESERLAACAFPLLRLCAVLLLAKVLAPPSPPPDGHPPDDPSEGPPENDGTHPGAGGSRLTVEVSRPGAPEITQSPTGSGPQPSSPPLLPADLAALPLRSLQQDSQSRSYERDPTAGPASGVLSQLRARQLSTEHVSPQNSLQQGAHSVERPQQQPRQCGGETHHLEPWLQAAQQVATDTGADYDLNTATHPGSPMQTDGATHPELTTHPGAPAPHTEQPHQGNQSDTEARAPKNGGSPTHPGSAINPDSGGNSGFGTQPIAAAGHVTPIAHSKSAACTGEYPDGAGDYDIVNQHGSSLCRSQPPYPPLQCQHRPQAGAATASATASATRLCGRTPPASAHLEPAPYQDAAAHRGSADRPGAPRQPGMLRTSLLDHVAVSQPLEQQWPLQVEEFQKQTRILRGVNRPESSLNLMLPSLREHSYGSQTERGVYSEQLLPQQADQSVRSLVSAIEAQKQRDQMLLNLEKILPTLPENIPDVQLSHVLLSPRQHHGFVLRSPPHQSPIPVASLPERDEAAQLPSDRIMQQLRDTADVADLMDGQDPILADTDPMLECLVDPQAQFDPSLTGRSLQADALPAGMMDISDMRPASVQMKKLAEHGY